MSNTLIITSVAVSLGFSASFVHSGWSPVPAVTYKAQSESLKSLKFEGENAVNLLKQKYNFIFTFNHISVLKYQIYSICSSLEISLHLYVKEMEKQIIMDYD